MHITCVMCGVQRGCSGGVQCEGVEGGVGGCMRATHEPHWLNVSVCGHLLQATATADSSPSPSHSAPSPPLDLYEELGVLLGLVAQGGRYVLVSSEELAGQGQEQQQ